MRSPLAVSLLALALNSPFAVACSSSNTNPLENSAGGSGGGADAALDSAAGFCASLSPAPRFCDDFDRPGPAGYGWNDLVAEKASVTLDTEFAASPPASALMQMTGTGACAYADLQKHFDVPPAAALRVAFSLRAGDGKGNAGDAAVIAAFYFEGTGGANACHAFLNALGDQSHLVLATNPPDADAATTLGEPGFAYYAVNDGSWARYEIAIAPGDGGVPTVTASVDGKAALDPVALPQCGLGGKANVILGIFCTDPPARELRIDDVVIDDK